MAADLTEQIACVREATRRLLDGLSGLRDADVARPALCPGWTAGHVLTHIARNADALRRVAEGAELDQVRSPYDSGEAREAGIEAGAARPAAVLTADVAESAQRLHDAWQALDDGAWDRPLLHHRLGRIPVRDTPPMRWSEVEIHRVDLAGDYGPADWPAPFVAHVLDGTAGKLASRLRAGTAVEVHATDTGARWTCGSGGAGRVTVAGPSWAIAAWLTGRVDPVRESLSAEGGDLPVLGAFG